MKVAKEARVSMTSPGNDLTLTPPKQQSFSISSLPPVPPHLTSTTSTSSTPSSSSSNREKVKDFNLLKTKIIL